MSRTQGFSKATGTWLGCAEVYSSEGRFLGNGTDRRNVQKVDETRVRIDLSFIGPFKFSGHYFIEDRKTERLYQGPANVGYAEPLSDSLVDSNSYWASIGMTQRFFLMVLPNGDQQVSMAQLSRGDQLIYTVIGENSRVEEETGSIPNLINGSEYDFAQDPTAGRGEILLHRSGTWQGSLIKLDENLAPVAESETVETVKLIKNQLTVSTTGAAFDPQPATVKLNTNQFQAWSQTGEVVGSYNLSGGRALSGHFQHLRVNLRVWKREVVLSDGLSKAVVHIWYRGGQRIGAQFGILNFESEN